MVRGVVQVLLVLVFSLCMAAPTCTAHSPEVPLWRDLSSDQVASLVVAYNIALHRLEVSSECRAMFETLQANGPRLIRHLVFLPAVEHEDLAQRCREGAFALARPGNQVVWLCPAFGSLLPQRAATTVLHEGLHVAGVEGDDMPLSQWVSAACGTAPPGYGEPRQEEDPLGR